MIISKKYATQLNREGKCRFEGLCFHDGVTYMIVTRFDLQRTDHFVVGDGDLR